MQVIGSVNTMLRLIYGDAYTSNNVQSNVASIAFAGTVLGHLVFGVLSDRWSRKNSLLISTIGRYPCWGSESPLIYGSTYHLLNSMCWRIWCGRQYPGHVCGLAGVSLSDRHWHWRRIVRKCGQWKCSMLILHSPAGSVGAAESTGELKKGRE
jgi:MFS family permease